MSLPGAGGNIAAILLIAFIVFSYFSTAILSADARTIVVSGGVSSGSHVRIVDTFVISGISPAQLSNDSRVTYNAPAFEGCEVNGFSQQVSGLSITAATQGSVPATVDHQMTDAFNNRYKRYEWPLAGYPGTTFTITVTTEFDCLAAASPAPAAFTEAYPVSAPGMGQYLAATPMVQSGNQNIAVTAQNIVSGAATEAEAVERVIDYVREHVAEQDAGQRDALWTHNNGRGNCVNRANYVLALLRAAGIPARYVMGLVSDQPYQVSFVAPEGSGTYDTRWGKEMHTWIEVYYPQHGWVPYDPLSNKGFVDHRHIRYGTALESLNPATADESLGGAGTVLRTYLNAGTSMAHSTAIEFTQAQDTGSYAFRSLKDSPGGSSIYVLGRDMANAATPTPAPTATATPTPTPLPNASATPAPNATASVTPTQWPGATATPAATPAPTQAATTGVNVTPGGNAYYVSGVIVDAKTGARLRDATITFDGRPVMPDSAGSFTVPASNGTHTLVVSVPGYATGSVPVTVDGADVPIVFQVNEPATGGGTGTGWTVPIPGFGLAAALAGILIIALYRYGRA